MIADKEIVGLAPCAGYATRISPLPCSKEIYPVGFYTSEDGTTSRTKAIASYLFENMKNAGASYISLVIRKGKWDIPAYFGNGTDTGIPIYYIVTDPTPGPAFTIDEAYPFIKTKQVLFGFPDIFIRPKDAFSALLERQKRTGSDIVLGLFEADNPKKVDMVEFNAEGSIKQIVIKPRQTTLTHTWLIAVWQTRFTQFIHDFVSEKKRRQTHGTESDSGESELHVGNIIREAITAGLDVNSHVFPEGEYLDIGTADDLKKAPEFVQAKDC